MYLSVPELIFTTFLLCAKGFRDEGADSLVERCGKGHDRDHSKVRGDINGDI